MTMDTAALILFTFLMGICLLATLAFLLHYVGFLQHVQVSRGKPTIDNVWIAYKDHVGPYEKCGPHFTEVSSLLPKLECIGIYYDDPKEVPADELRYVVGVVICKGDEKPSQTNVTLLESRNFKIFQLPTIDDAVIAQFPFIMNISAILGAKKVYPALEAYIKYHKVSAHPFIEYYAATKIHYFAPLCKQSDFFVPEVKYGHQSSKLSAIVEESTNEEESLMENTDENSDEESQGTTSSFEEIFADQAAQNDAVTQ